MCKALGQGNGPGGNCAQEEKKGIISCILYLIMIITKLHELTDIYL
jgi:hypothetical protein